MEWWMIGLNMIWIAICSLIVIYCSHQIFNFVVNTFTTTKVKNNPSSQTYNAILSTLQTQTLLSPSSHTTPIYHDDISLNTSQVNQPPLYEPSMEDELRNFMKQQMT